MTPAALLNSPTRATAARRTQRCHGLASVSIPSPAPAVLYSAPPWSTEPSVQFHSFDAGYVESLCAGDLPTQDHFVTYFTALIKLKLRFRLNSPQAVEDVRQETFTRVFTVLRRDGGLRQPERLGAFVNTVCNHVLFEHYRSSGGSESLDDEGRPELPSRDAGVEDVVSARESSEQVRRILLELPLRDRQLLKAVFLDERERDEVCQEFGVDRDYLRVLLHRAKLEFKAEYLKRIARQAPVAADSRKV